MTQEFRSKAEQQRALDALNREYEKLIRIIKNDLLDRRDPNGNWPDDRLRDLYFSMPLNLFQWTARRSEELGRDFDVSAIEALVAKREEIRKTPIAVKVPAADRKRQAVEGARLGLVSKLKGNVSLVEALDAHKPSLIKRYREQLEKQLATIMKITGGNLAIIAEHQQWAGAFRLVFRPLLAPMVKGEPFRFDPEKLDAFCDKQARDTIDQWIYKIHEKLGLLEEARAKSLDDCRFLISGKKDGRQVEIQQDMILNFSVYGTPFNQFPARIYVEGRFCSEEQFRQMFEAHDRAQAQEQAPGRKAAPGPGMSG